LIYEKTEQNTETQPAHAWLWNDYDYGMFQYK